jgi:pimeloyl-ACP methyl ester carboxylesterase
MAAVELFFIIFLAAVLFLAALTATPARAASSGDFAGLVNIGHGRQIYMKCRGRGSPAVVLISGKGNGAADWSEILDPADPLRKSPYDMAGHEENARIYRSDAAVFPAVSRFTHVCAYDRPSTRIEGKDISTPVKQPHTVDKDVDDLQKLLAASGQHGPYVLVAHSYGGLIARLFARQHRNEVAGLVFVDIVSEYMQRVANHKALAQWDKLNRISSPQAPEAVELLDAFAKIDAAPELPRVPNVVLSADKPWDPVLVAAMYKKLGGAAVTWKESLAAQDLLAASAPAEHIKQTNSGHFVYTYQPALVVNAIRMVVDEVRRSSAR